MIAAFTGTRKGMTSAQKDALIEVMKAEMPTMLHNGCAVGADEQCLEIVRPLPILLELWPASFDRYRRCLARFAGTYHHIAEPIWRNKRMVYAADLVIACPDGPEVVRSGTWSTVRFARQQGKRVIIVWPDGRVER